MFRDLLVHVDGSDAGRRRVKFAAALAERMQARLNGLHVTPPADVPVQCRASLIDRISDEISTTLELDARESAAIFREEAEELMPEASWSKATGDVVTGVCNKARYADLVILGQYESQGRPENHPFPIAHSVISKCGRPVLVVPGETASSMLTRAAIVWDRSREAIRTIHDALPLLRLAGSVQIVVIEPRPGDRCEVDAASLRIHLANHEVQVEPHAVRIPDHAALNGQIEIGAYDLLVIGGYSTPAWVNFLFRSVTQSILLSSAIPVFVSQ